MDLAQREMASLGDKVRPNSPVGWDTGNPPLMPTSYYSKLRQHKPVGRLQLAIMRCFWAADGAPVRTRDIASWCWPSRMASAETRLNDQFVVFECSEYRAAHGLTIQLGDGILPIVCASRHLVAVEFSEW